MRRIHENGDDCPHIPDLVAKAFNDLPDDVELTGVRHSKARCMVIEIRGALESVATKYAECGGKDSIRADLEMVYDVFKVRDEIDELYRELYRVQLMTRGKGDVSQELIRIIKDEAWGNLSFKKAHEKMRFKYPRMAPALKKSSFYDWRKEGRFS